VLGHLLTILRVFTGTLQCIVSTPKHSCCLLKDKDTVYICFQTVTQSYLYDHEFTLMDYILPAQDAGMWWCEGDNDLTSQLCGMWLHVIQYLGASFFREPSAPS
jgi:hypothetical protein